MRSLRIERKPRRRRVVKSGRNAPRAARATPAPAKFFGKRKPPNFLDRALRATHAWITLRRPMLALAACLIAAAFFAALLVGGYVGRGFGRVTTTAGSLTDDAGFGISQVHLAGNRRV